MAGCWMSMSMNKSSLDYLSMVDKHCSTMKDLQKIHCHLIKTGRVKDPFAASRILAFCTTPAGDINYAHLLFSRIQNPNLFMWNTIIRGFSQSSHPERAISLFIEMLVDSDVRPHRLTYPSVFKAYSQLGLPLDGAPLHGRVIKEGLQSDQFIFNSIVHMYINCGFLSEARRMFDEEEDKEREFDIVCWNSMIMGLAKYGEIDESRKLFDKMLLRNIVSWNSMISGYVRNGRYQEALELFGKLQEENNIKPDELTMVSLLNACAKLGAIRQGEWIHFYIKKNNFELNPILVTAIIDMYCKCGSPRRAFWVFKNVPIYLKGLSCWNSMILGLAMNGFENEAITLFSELEKTSQPDNVSFLGVLTACNHSGMVDKVKEYFSLMTNKYKIRPSIQHFNSVVDAWGRNGLIEEAEAFITSMPSNPDAIIWGSLLSACRKHGNLEVAKRAAKHMIELDKNESCGYVLMSNIYGASGAVEEAMVERILMKHNNIEKEPGCSLIEVDGEVHEFTAGGRLHPKSKKIYLLLDKLELVIQEYLSEF